MIAFGSTFYLTGSLPSSGTNSGGFGTNQASAVTSAKLEDISTSPLDPTKVVLAVEVAGVFEIAFNLKFSGGTFSSSTSSFVIKKLPFAIPNPDNVDWTLDDSIFITSDTSTGNVWHGKPSEGIAPQIATSKKTGER